MSHSEQPQGLGSTAPADDGDYLLVADMVPAEHVAEPVRGTPSERILRLLFSKRNRIGVRRPLVKRVEDSSGGRASETFGLPWGNEVTFRWVVSTVGCLPDPDCRFSWLELGLEFDGDGEARPIACRLYPERSDDVVSVVDKSGLPQVNLELAGIASAELTPEFSRERSYERRQYRTVSYGSLSSNPRWRFATTPVNHEIIGDFSVMALVAARAGHRSEGSVSLSAQVQLKTAAPKLPLVMSRTTADAAGAMFVLDP